MTKEEALRKTKGYLTDVIPLEDYEEVEEIVKALKQEPCEDCKYKTFTKLYFHTDPEMVEQESCKVAVSKQAVNTLIDELAKAISDERCCISRGRSTATIMRDIRRLAPVAPQPKMGRWTNGDPICPCCGEDKFKDLDADIWADWQPKYCPNCGAKMVEQKGKRGINE